MTVSDSVVNRMVRAAKLEPALYEEVEADQTATPQALIVITLVSILTGIGAGIGGIGTQGTQIFKGPSTSSTWGECLRTIGFASSK